MKGHRDLELAAAGSIVCALIAVVIPWEPVRIVAALPLALFLPGYGIIAAAFGSHRLALPYLLMLSLGTSLAVLALGALLLNYLPGGIRTESWALLLTVVIVLTCYAASVRRPQPARQQGARHRPYPRRLDVVCGLVAIVAAIAALILASTPLPAGGAVGYTALWMLPHRFGAQDAVEVGIASAEHSPQAYTLEVQVQGRKPNRTIQLSLGPGDERVFELPVSPGRPAGRTAVVATLYQRGAAKPYRWVRTWLAAGGSAG
ncbi:MAG TPA: DUF1616 domain-containing protein [Candidatus Dormibacteraeota bacterium]|nr:DUF1616 domain-containing protein [Candidatus Dormibacteraeota bacterium]